MKNFFRFKIAIWTVLILVLLAACNSNSSINEKSNSVKGQQDLSIQNYSFQTQIKYAKWFKIKYLKEYKQIDVISPWTKEIYWSYKCYPKETTAFSENNQSNIGEIKSAAVLSSTVIGMFKALGIQDKIQVIGNEKYIADSTIFNRAHNGQLAQVGDMGNINMEAIVLKRISIIFDSAWNTISPNTQKLIDQNIPTAFILDWQEQTPLARAEWIKFVAAFFNLEALADRIFNEVEKDYLSTKKEVQNKGQSITILHASPMSGTWYVAGGNSYVSQLYKDAGVSYLWQQDSVTGSLPLSFEAIFLKAKDADFWFTSSTFNQIKDFVQADKRYDLFKAVKNKHVITLKPMQDNGRPNAFWEEGNIYPNLILKDLISIFYDKNKSNNSLRYYQRLQ